MNYRAFFSNPKRHWWKESTGTYRSDDGYVVRTDDDPRYSGHIWNLWKFDRTAFDGYRCIGHDVDFSPDMLPE